jgi:hypothetical protein
VNLKGSHATTLEGEATVRVCPRAAGTSATTKAAIAKDFIVVVEYLKEW